jgi:hypothetical protein
MKSYPNDCSPAAEVALPPAAVMRPVNERSDFILYFSSPPKSR